MNLEERIKILESFEDITVDYTPDQSGLVDLVSRYYPIKYKNIAIGIMNDGYLSIGKSCYVKNEQIVWPYFKHFEREFPQFDVLKSCIEHSCKCCEKATLKIKKQKLKNKLRRIKSDF